MRNFKLYLSIRQEGTLTARGTGVGAVCGVVIGNVAGQPGQCYYRNRYGRRYVDAYPPLGFAFCWSVRMRLSLGMPSLCCAILLAIRSYLSSMLMGLAVYSQETRDDVFISNDATVNIRDDTSTEPGDWNMVSFFSGLRYILLLASIAVLFGAFLMFWEAILMLWQGFRLARLNPDLSVIVAVLRATDKILLGIVLMVVGCGIALGFALDISAEQRTKLPQWMIIDTVAELKNLFFQMIILYLVVHFAAQVGEMQTPPDWNALVLPVSALLLGGAMKLAASSSDLSEQGRQGQSDRHPGKSI